MDKELINIFDGDLANAQNICASISDAKKRNRAVANVIGAKIASSYFNKETYRVDTESGLHNITPVIENFEISDIYVNDFYIDIRVYFSDDELCIPKSHLETGILPIAYMFIKLSQDLSKGEVTGFISTNDINKEHYNQNYYIVTPKELKSFYDIESVLYGNPGSTSIDDKRIFEFIEGSLSEEENISFLADLLKSKYARLKLIKAINAQSVYNFVSLPDLNKNTLNEPLLDNNSINEVQDLTESDLEGLFDSDNNDTEINEYINSNSEDNDSSQENSYYTEVTPSGADIIESVDEENSDYDKDENEEQLENLFTGEKKSVPLGTSKKSGILVILLLLILLAGGGYWWYYNSSSNNNEVTNNEIQADNVNESAANNNNSTEVNSSMPVETVEDVPSQKTNAEAANTTEIPTIEKNLDASILVSNLKIDWEVPSGYVTNSSAKRYLLKLGKIIQLNLKSELLLLQKPPLSNRITIELKYNSTAGKFEVVGIKDSSGEKSVDDIILQTLNNALKLNISSNTESFGKIAGNPVLIIRL